MAEFNHSTNVRTISVLDFPINHAWFLLILFNSFLANAVLGSTPLSSPLESPDLIQTLLPFGEIGATTASVSSVKLSIDNLHLRNQQVRQFRPNYSSYNSNTNCITSQIMTATAALTTMRKASFRSGTGVRYTSALPGSISELPELNLSSSTKSNSQSCHEETDNSKASSECRTHCDLPTIRLGGCGGSSGCGESSSGGHSLSGLVSLERLRNRLRSGDSLSSHGSRDHHQQHAKTLAEFSLSSVGRSFIDSENEGETQAVAHSLASTSNRSTLKTPDTPPPNVSPSSSNLQCGSETLSINDSVKRSPHHRSLTPIEDQIVFKSGSWDLLELDLDFHQVNLDPSLGNIVEELVFFGDDPYGMLPSKPTEPNLADL